MTDKIEVTHLIEPEPLFSCLDENCRIEYSWPAGDLRQGPEGPICENCYDENARSDEPRYETLPPFVPTFQAELTQARAEIARLCEALEKICVNSNTDWDKVSADPLGYIKRVHSLAVDAYYARRTHND